VKLKYAKYKEDLTLPQSDNTDTDKLVTSTNAGIGAIEVVMEVTEEVTISASDSATFTLKSENAGGTTTVTHSNISLGTGTYAVGYEKVLFVIPSDALYKTYINVATDDDDAAGKITIYQNYLPK
jgi:hypothetical protein